MNVADYLLPGKKNAVPMCELANMLDVPERSLRKEILIARINGSLICSCDQGYFLPENDDDIREYVTMRKAFIKTMNKALKPFIKAIR